jgi:hypothetical protein
MAVWFGLERLAYIRTKGEYWFLQLLPRLARKLHWPNMRRLNFQTERVKRSFPAFIRPRTHTKPDDVERRALAVVTNTKESYQGANARLARYPDSLVHCSLRSI